MPMHAIISQLLSSPRVTLRAPKNMRAALSIGPAKTEYHHNLGLALEARDDAAEAIEAFQQALSLDFANEAAFESLCGLLFEQDDPARVYDLCG